MPNTKPCNPFSAIKDLYSGSVIQGGRRKPGRKLSCRSPSVRLAALVGNGGKFVTLVASIGRGREPGEGKRGRLSRPRSESGKVMVGGEFVPSGCKSAPRSTQFTTVTKVLPQCTPPCGMPLVPKSIGAPAETTTSPAAFR